jgi:3',5'-cyclic AMP phosphodiesterase CpdA
MKKVFKIFLGIILVIGIIIAGLSIANSLVVSHLNEYIDTFAKVEIEDQLIPEYDENGEAYFTTDEDFKIMQLTDVHLGGSILSITKDKSAMNAIAAMINAEKPDLVVVTGDISYAVPWALTLNNGHAHNMFIRFMENLGVYWTVTFGNHDAEPYDYYNRSDVAGFYEDEELKYCLFDSGPDDVYGECNHAITVRSTDGIITKSIIMIDSNAYMEEDVFGFGWIYDNIHQDQIDWYRNTIESHNAHNKSINPNIEDSVESLLFMHIPIMEVRDAYHEYLAAGETDTENVKHLFGEIGEEDPYVYCSEEAEQMFETILELGSTKAIFYGHDHLNNIVLDYKGVALSYGYSVDYFAYFGIDKTGSQRGCTIITSSPGGATYITHENYYQDKYIPQYEKESVSDMK